MVGMLYERCHTRDLALYGGLAKILPLYAVFFTLLALASVGLPTTSGFTGEFLVLLGYFVSAWPQFGQGHTLPLALAVIAVSGVVLGALYMLWLAQRLLYGPVKAPHQPFGDLNGRERAILAALAAAIFWLGIFPAEPMHKTEAAARHYQKVVTAPAAAPVALGRTP
jgi:NADH-quinone oxidoreductase subunit M